jgi:hypothetical protein
VANTNFPINVNVNFAGVTYSNGSWYNSPTWTVNPSLQGVPPVKLGVNTNTLVWSLHAAAVPQGFTASFATPGIAFVGTPVWTGGTPQNLDSQTCAVADNFNGLAANETYEYNISVTLSNGTVSNTWVCDPDVQNESGTMNIAALVRTRK